MTKVLSNTEPKGTSDWFPEEFLIRQYIFNTWRKVCLRYGFEEYLTPLVESADIYRAKSGEDIGGKELVTFTDLGGRELAIRPEMTPSVTRLVSKIFNSSPKPLKYFSIANFMRNEKPQRGRNREFWQLNCDIFGSDSLQADTEIIQLALDLMLEFKPPQNSFVLAINNRKLIEDILNLSGANFLAEDKKLLVVRTLDKWQKLKTVEIQDRLKDAGLDQKAREIIDKFMSSTDLDDLLKKLPSLKKSLGLEEICQVTKTLEDLGYGEWLEFNPAVIRGFDYYDGLVFEVFDNSPKNNRALFGGGRYNGLANIFGLSNFPALGFAPGDETTKLFLESWGLLSKAEEFQTEKYYLPLLKKDLRLETEKLAQKLRAQGKNVLLGFEEKKIGKALEFANKKGIEQVVILGEEEILKKIYKLKDMKSGHEELKKL